MMLSRSMGETCSYKAKTFYALLQHSLKGPT